VKFLKQLSLLLALISLAATVRAQIVGATINGTVHDTTGAIVPGAKVEVRQLETGATRTLTTSADGEFNAPSVPVGHYIVTVSLEGFNSQRQSGSN